MSGWVRQCWVALLLASLSCQWAYAVPCFMSTGFIATDKASAASSALNQLADSSLVANLEPAAGPQHKACHGGEVKDGHASPSTTPPSTTESPGCQCGDDCSSHHCSSAGFLLSLEMPLPVIKFSEPYSSLIISLVEGPVSAPYQPPQFL